MEKEKKIPDSIKHSENPFQVPENYFSDFSKNLENKLQESVEKQKKRSLYRNIRPWLYAAASVFIVGFGIKIFLSNLKPMVTETAENVGNVQLLQEHEGVDTLLYTYLDDLMIIDYLISKEESTEKNNSHF